MSTAKALTNFDIFATSGVWHRANIQQFTTGIESAEIDGIDFQ